MGGGLAGAHRAGGRRRPGAVARPAPGVRVPPAAADVPGVRDEAPRRESPATEADQDGKLSNDGDGGAVEKLTCTSSRLFFLTPHTGLLSSSRDSRDALE